jgi:dTDP-glucose 4,6-dehydratase/UDP-glucuronate decarboxylase
VTEYDHSIIDEDCKSLADRTNFDALRDKTVFIIGANGLIGSFLSDFFCYLNDHYSYNIKIILTSYSAPDKAMRVRNVLHREDVRYFSWDCSQRVDEKKLDDSIEYVFFCAGYGQPAKFLENAVKTTLINIVGLDSVLSFLKNKTACGKLLFLSSSEIYGSPPPSKVPTPESYIGYHCFGPRACYVTSKVTGEILCNEYNKLENLNVKIARVALTYGPGVLKTDVRVLQNFIFKAAEQAKIKMLDAGDSRRNYLYITDCVEMLLNILLYGKDTTYNVGGDIETVSIFELAKKSAAIFKAPVVKGTEATKQKFIQSAPPRVGLSMEKYRKEFSSYGKDIIKLNEGLINVVKWFKLSG